jgi:hypothetical protein
MLRPSRVLAISSLLGLTLVGCEQPTADRPGPVHAQLAASATPTFYTDRAAFVAQFPNLPLEDFETGKVLDGGVVACQAPVSSASNDNCFSPGDIKPGVAFDSDPQHHLEVGGIDVVGPGMPLGALSKNIVAGSPNDAFTIDFPLAANVTAIGMDLIGYFAVSCQIDIFGANGQQLGTTITAPCTNQGTFWGVSSDQVITRIRVFSPSLGFEGVDNIAFGSGIQRLPPIANARGPYSGTEGTAVTFDGGASATNPPGGVLTYAWDFGDGTSNGTGVTGSHVYADNRLGGYTVTLTVTDAAGLTNAASAPVIIANVAPTVEAITASLAPVPINSLATAGAAFTDPGILDTHTGVFDWGDGTSSPALVTESNGSGSVSGGHAYTAVGVYTVALTVTDKDGGVGQSVFQFLVVYDPLAGFVTGGGWILSPPGAYTADQTLTGKATFGFVAAYQPGARVPSGNTEFQFHAAGFNFHSTSYDWLVVSGPKAQYKGSGTINGAGDFAFRLTAVDDAINGSGGADKFRIKIWDKGTGLAIYDNQLNAGDGANPTTVLGGGQILIHH